MKSQRAKVLHPLLGRPLCAYPIECALKTGATQVVAVVGHQSAEVQRAVTEEFPGAPITFALQAEQKGTAHAVLCAKESLAAHEGPILILYGDTPLLRTEVLVELTAQKRRAGVPLALLTTKPPHPRGYGRVVRVGGVVARIVEDKDCTPEEAAITECNAGIYAVDSQFLWEGLSSLGNANAQGEFYLTDLVEKAASRGAVCALEVPFTEASGVNDRSELAACAKVMQARINHAHMVSGVALLHPESTFIHSGTQLGQDTEVEPFVSIGAGCEVGRNVKIGQGSVLLRTKVGDNTEIRPYSVLEDAEVAEGCIIGPFARLRPGSKLSSGVHIGNFVETKKATLGPGSKANHLSYLGDAEIGAGVNVGAGTITCNYDGKNKYTTVIEDGAFIGSDSQLVAPVRVGTGAYVGAGTTVTRDVPKDALAVSRAPLTVKEGWAAQKRAALASKGTPSNTKGKSG
jgi:bifunctional UDP-N-acetylglucosamine pyrophosphorylase/glucosamine-1-phosphate N-acetyltransferase